MKKARSTNRPIRTDAGGGGAVGAKALGAEVVDEAGAAQGLFGLGVYVVRLMGSSLFISHSFVGCVHWI